MFLKPKVNVSEEMNRKRKVRPYETMVFGYD